MCFFFYFLFYWVVFFVFFFFSSRRRHTRFSRDWSSDVCSSDLFRAADAAAGSKGALHRSGERNARKGHRMPLYEHVFLARQDISQTQVEALTKEYGEVIAEGGGRVAKTEYWGLKSLAFKIKKNRKAHYALMNIDAPPSAVAEMERRMGLSADVIRFLTVRVERHETEPSVQMRKSDRDERREGERGGFRGERG